MTPSRMAVRARDEGEAPARARKARHGVRMSEEIPSGSGGSRSAGRCLSKDARRASPSPRRRNGAIDAPLVVGKRASVRRRRDVSEDLARGKRTFAASGARLRTQRASRGTARRRRCRMRRRQGPSRGVSMSTARHLAPKTLFYRAFETKSKIHIFCPNGWLNESREVARSAPFGVHVPFTSQIGPQKSRNSVNKLGEGHETSHAKGRAIRPSRDARRDGSARPRALCRPSLSTMSTLGRS